MFKVHPGRGTAKSGVSLQCFNWGEEFLPFSNSEEGKHASFTDEWKYAGLGKGKSILK